VDDPMRIAARSAAVLALLAFAGATATALARDALAAPERAVTVVGTVTRLTPAERTVAITTADGANASFRWNADTKINGVLAPGARVTIRYSTDASGTNLALQITVAKS
jgi:hypothetical protein